MIEGFCKYDRRVLLRLTEFILPPPHPSVKEMYPRGPFPTIKFLKQIIKDRKSGIAIEKRHRRGNAFPLRWPPLGRKCNLESFSLRFLFEKNRRVGV
jgi:hypothetical protein